MKYQLIALDLDGTLKNKDNKITPKTKEALLKAQASGAKLILSSGRPTGGLRFEADELLMKKYGGYLLSYNGANIKDYQTNEVIYSKSLTAQQAKEIYAYANELKLATMVYDDLTIITDKFGEKDQYVMAEKINVNFDIVVYDDICEHLPSTIEKLLLTGDPSYLEKCEKQFVERFPNLSIYRSAPFFLEVMSNGINKGESLNHLLKHLKMNALQLMAFGDGYNDKSMIEVAGLGVAMGNAVEGVKEVADVITLDNNHDGIAEIINKYF